MPDLTMPRLSDSMEEGTLIQWLVTDGAQVAAGEDVVEIETDKATMVYQSEFSGTMAITAAEGDTLSVGARIGAVLAPGEARPALAGGATAEPEISATAADPGSPLTDAGFAAPADAAASAAGDPAGAGPAAALGARIQATPVARRIARSLHVDLAALIGTGRSGRVVKRDVLAAADGRRENATSQELAGPARAITEPAQEPAERPSPSPPSRAGTSASTDGGRGEVEVHLLSRVQATIARRMVEAKSAMPEFTLETVVDMEAAVALRAELKQLDGAVVPSLNDFIIRAAALALRAHPAANGAYRNGTFELYSRVNVGVAVAVPGSLVVPTVYDADRCSLGEIARETRRLAAAARAGELTAADLGGGTFSVSNLGMFGISRFTAVLNPPQAAILAVGALEPVPVVREGVLVSSPRMALTLTCDHRILYGADAAAFLADIRANLEAPLRLAL